MTFSQLESAFAQIEAAAKAGAPKHNGSVPAWL